MCRQIVLACAASLLMVSAVVAQPADAGTPPVSASKEFREEDAIVALKEAVAERSRDGAFVLHDAKTHTDLKLVFDEMKMVRGMRGYGWFPNAIFHDVAEPKKKYAVDFWFRPNGDKLELVDIRIQKGRAARVTATR